jgi:hypothetical protein
MKATNRETRRYWLWVARPDIYLDEDGNEWGGLEPSDGFTKDEWWTCHKDTRRGDLILLWRTAPKSDIGYLIGSLSSPV